MADRDRLIELLQSVPADYEGNRGVGCIADYLLANGVIVPPCKVGDKVYVDSNTWGINPICYEHQFIHSKYFLVGEIVSIIKTKKQLLMKIRVSNSIHTRYKHQRYTVNAIGITVFLTKEEAEKALAKMGGKDGAE